MPWNYRLARKSGKLGPLFSIIEVYYNIDGEPDGWCDSCTLHTDMCDTVEEAILEFEGDLSHMLDALKAPVIDLDNFPREVV